MANSSQARKRARQSEMHRQRNASRRSMMRTHVKKVAKLAASGDADNAAAALKAAGPVIDSTASKGLVHKNKAARLKSRLNKRVKALAQPAG